jgi:hypothetical protein
MSRLVAALRLAPPTYSGGSFSDVGIKMVERPSTEQSPRAMMRDGAHRAMGNRPPLFPQPGNFLPSLVFLS